MDTGETLFSLLLCPWILLGCPDPEPVTPSGSTATTGDSGLAGARCDGTVAPRRLFVCADVANADAPPSPLDLEGTGSVTAVGTGLPPVSGATAVFPFSSACGTDHLAVRLVDADGATWTMGFDLEGPPVPLLGVDVGDEIAFRLVGNPPDYLPEDAIVLSDDEGLLLVAETQAVLDDAARGGIAAQVDGDDTCVQRDSPNDVNDHFLVRVGTPVKASLRSGQSTDLTVGGQDLTFLVAGAYRTRDCADGCGDLSWLVTRRTP